MFSSTKSKGLAHEFPRTNLKNEKRTFDLASIVRQEHEVSPGFGLGVIMNRELCCGKDNTEGYTRTMQWNAAQR
eukprot:2681397-Amphidinium_carterae.1